MLNDILAAATVPAEQSNRFFRCFVNDLAPHADAATNGTETVDSCREVIAWYLANEPTDNGLFDDAAEGEAFLAWFDARRAELIAVASDAFDLD